MVELKKLAKGGYKYRNSYISKKKKPTKKVSKFLDINKIDPNRIYPPILLRGTLRKYQF